MAYVLGLTPTVACVGERKKPLWVHCSNCLHTWALGLTPMDMDKAVTLMKKARCVFCPKAKVWMGRAKVPVAQGDAIGWLEGGDTGTSSLTIWAKHFGRTPREWNGPGEPNDAADFARCERLLRLMPEWSIETMRCVGNWCYYVDAWPSFVALYDAYLAADESAKAAIWKSLNDLVCAVADRPTASGVQP